MVSPLICTAGILLCCSFTSPANAVWTEEDESQRIAMIINNDKKAFEEEMRSQRMLTSPANTRASLEARREVLRNPPPPPTPPRSNHSENAGESWCYHCTSPMKSLSRDMKKTIQQFLQLRRATYPEEVSTEECVNAKNLSLLHKQKCRHRHCTTISLVDHNQGASFVLRGCAENFGAVDEKYLEKQGDNSCTRLHEHLDMQECLCGSRPYCFAGYGRRKSSSSPTLSLLLLIAFLL